MADPVKIASLNRFTSMLETLFDQEDQLSSDGTYNYSQHCVPEHGVLLIAEQPVYMQFIIHLNLQGLLFVVQTIAC